MTFQNAVILDLATYNPDELDLSGLTDLAENWTHYDYTNSDELHARIAEADLVITNKVVFDEATFKLAPNLKLIAVGATGVNNIHLDAAKTAGVSVCNVKGYSTQSVAQHVFAFMLMHAASIDRYDYDVKASKWQSAPSFTFLDHQILELHTKTLGIFGYGDIGRQVEAIAKAFGMNVLIADRKGADTLREGRSDFNDVIAQSDFITLHCPLTDETKDMINENALKAMKKSAFLVNCARGGVVNEAALVNALQSGEIAGAGVDVLTVEPPRDGNPLLDDDIPNLIITPHTAWASKEARQLLFDQISAVIKGFLNDKPMNVVV